jgi:histidine triad (HIT) family protein
MADAPGTDDCVFCAIVAGRAPAHVVHRDHGVVAFLDRVPLFHGHTLVVPRDHHVTLADLPADELAPYFSVVQLLSRAVPEATGAVGSFVAGNNLVSQSVPHLHTHVVPRTRGDGLKGFFWPRHRYDSDEQMAEVAASVRDAIARLSP